MGRTTRRHYRPAKEAFALKRQRKHWKPEVEAYVCALCDKQGIARVFNTKAELREHKRDCVSAIC